MRSFIGLDLAGNTKMALESWREQALPDVPRREALVQQPAKKRRGGKNTPPVTAQPYAVPTVNLHMTLCFLGAITPRQHEALIAEMDALTYQPFDLHLDTAGVWNGPKILFAAPTEPPQELLELARGVRKAARAAGLHVEGKEYKPHVTLVRKAGPTLPIPLMTPDIQCHFADFHLFESVSTPTGVTYPIRHTWQLRHQLSVREKLRRGLI
ncbi:RNA 2',3'-cyclic phosphodiesterase [Alteromonas sp. ASW11-19]|uniref:RNA 2',3'-cyclic phosphodiesterase n=1 Tax=Alteromonas salexigens TaxID=2982530 RepID=A0ABT2VK38_9ALTE|nr:RNA 2',3'-cyclic phosphodiesterase [Alteromonas salexigens]MCU7553359.1 RNA 2',3'-cyclic phosphodiesterase [Alteromonas salexigens]